MARRQGTPFKADLSSLQDLVISNEQEDASSLIEAYRPDAASQRLVFHYDEAGAQSLATDRRREYDDKQTLVTVGGQSATATLAPAWVNEALSAHRSEDTHQVADALPYSPLNESQTTTWSGQNCLVMRDFIERAGSDKKPEVMCQPRTATHEEIRGKPVAIKLRDPSGLEYAPTLSGRGQKRLMKELAQLARIDISDDWTAGLSRVHRLDDFVAFFTGPKGTAYEGGIFYVRFRMSPDHPIFPPVCQMLTKVYHPNIDSRGRICMSVLYKDWNPALVCEKLLASIASMLDSPNVEDPLVIEIAEQYMRDRPSYYEIAKEYTRKYATGELPETHIEDDQKQPWWLDAHIDQEGNDVQKKVLLAKRWDPAFLRQNG